MKKFLSEFKEFALRGNVLDMAIGVVIGGAFGKITTSLVNDVIMPLVGMLIGGQRIPAPGFGSFSPLEIAPERSAPGNPCAARVSGCKEAEAFPLSPALSGCSLSQSLKK